MLNIRQDIDLAPLTTFKIGGTAKFFVEVKEKDELIEAVEWCEKNQQRFVILAGGSNVLVYDTGFDGLVIRMANNDINIRGHRIECGAGASLVQITGLAAANNLSGLEWAAGIPGSMGGAIRGNAGAYGGEIGEVVEVIDLLNIKTGKFELLSKRFCDFSYRDSLFKKDKNQIIWSATIKLESGNNNEITKKMNENITARIAKQPKLPSAGSFFKNIMFTDLQKANPKLAEEAKVDGAVREGKLAAAWLIDQLDLRGKKIGDAKVSLEHANFIVNCGNATAEDVITLTSLIKQQVRDKLKVQLVEEVEYITPHNT